MNVESGYFQGVYSVKSFGAVGDKKIDDTKAFQDALNKAEEDGGGIVFVPAGNYLIKGHLVIPEDVTLEGISKAPATSHPKEFRADKKLDARWRGSTLLAVEGEGDEDGEPFITLKTNATVKGLTVFYPDQQEKSLRPYPWCIRGVGTNCSVVNMLLVNPWLGVDFGTVQTARHFIDGLYAQALKTGVYVDQCGDIGRLNNIHLWPFWSIELMTEFTNKNSTGFLIGGCDWEYMDNSFCIGYKTGFHFTGIHPHHENRGIWAPNILITNSGPDESEDIAVLVDYSQEIMGISFTNCQVFGRIVVADTNYGHVTFNGCTVKGRRWSPTIAEIHGQGSVTFNACHFSRWDFKGEDKPCIYSDAYGLTVNACDFMMIDDAGRKPIELGPESKSSIITGNRFRTGRGVDNKSLGAVVIEGNLEI